MIDHDDPLREIEQRTHRLLQRQPLRSAPTSLEARVWSELGRLAALPWWRRNFSQWPLAARAAFLIACAGMSALTLAGNARIIATLAPFRRLAESFTWVTAAIEALESIARAIPAAWIYEVSAIAVLLYGAIFALGIVAYRSLYLDPLGSGSGT